MVYFYFRKDVRNILLKLTPFISSYSDLSMVSRGGDERGGNTIIAYHEIMICQQFFGHVMMNFSN